MSVYTRDPVDRCECSDPACPACHGNCQRRAYVVLYRVDMNDETGTVMCGQCAEDAYESGVFGVEEAEGYRMGGEEV